MALTRGCHLIEHGDHSAAAVTAPKIWRDGLMSSTSIYGAAVWAFYADMVPKRWRTSPLVVFDVDKEIVQRCDCPLPDRPDYAFMKITAPESSYITATIVGFVNVPNLPIYSGTIGFF